MKPSADIETIRQALHIIRDDIVERIMSYIEDGQRLQYLIDNSTIVASDCGDMGVWRLPELIAINKSGTHLSIRENIDILNGEIVG